MEEIIYLYQYFAIQNQVKFLISSYQSVNDPKTIEAVQAQAVEEINKILGNLSEEQIFAEFKEVILDRSLTNEKADRLLLNIKEMVIPFEIPTNKQLEKTFKKVKKLKVPNFESFDLKESSFIGWNDPGNQKKFIIYYADGKLEGIYGNQSNDSIKNVCSICHKTSQVALFLATTKTGSEGTYTKKGNYICTDSQNCNRQIIDINHFENFTQEVKFQK